jgi:hypothetical protein
MSAIYLLASLVTVPLSWLEHTRTIKPSPQICSYLLLSTLLDTAQVRTLWTMGASQTIASVFTASFAIRTLLLALECLPKKLTREVDIARSPEDKCGVISRSFFLWLLPLIYAGYRRTLGIDDLYAPPVDAAPSPLEKKLRKGWSECECPAKATWRDGS